MTTAMSTQATPVHIFWDGSNIFHGAQGAARLHGEAHLADAVRLHFEHLIWVARAGRPVARAVCVGSMPRDHTAIRARLARVGCEAELYPRTPGTSEQGIDQSLQVHLLRAPYDAEPGVAVLLTGDGAAYEEGAGFHADLERLYEAGWAVELLCWDHTCSRRLKEWVRAVGAYVPLDDYYRSVTFVEHHIRASAKPSLKRRPLSPAPVPRAA